MKTNIENWLKVLKCLKNIKYSTNQLKAMLKKFVLSPFFKKNNTYISTVSAAPYVLWQAVPLVWAIITKSRLTVSFCCCLWHN